MASGNVVKGTPFMYMPNLLVNGDFMINQRGKSTYIGAGYTLDMWSTYYATDKVTVNDDGITIENPQTNSNGYFFQNINWLEENDYCVRIIVEELVGNCRIAIHGTDLDTSVQPLLKVGENKFYIHGKPTKFEFRLGANAKIRLKHSGLHRGNILPPYIPEDHATAMMRCLERIVVYDNIDLHIEHYGFTNVIYDSILTSLSMPSPMIESPSVTISGIYLDSTSGATYSTQLYKYKIVGNHLKLQFKRTNGQAYNPETDKSYYVNLTKLIVSCEPQ